MESYKLQAISKASHVIILSTNQNVVSNVNTSWEKSNILKAFVDSLLRLVVLNRKFRLKVYIAVEQ